MIPRGAVVRKLENLESFGVPRRYASAELGDFETDFSWLVGRSAFLMGSRGVGKTHLMVALLKESIRRGHLSVCMKSVPRMLMEIRNNMKNVQGGELAYMERVTGYGLLFLDDLGVEKPSDWVLQTLYLIVDQRYNDNQPLVISSNFDLDEIATRLDDRIASRIVGLCGKDGLVELEGNDLRLGGWG